MKNVYDDPEFFRQYRELRLQDSGLNGLLEEPALRRRLGDPRGLDVLDIGCGFGHQARWLVAHGAAHVIGIDPSHRMIEEALRLTSAPEIEYRCGFAEDLAQTEAFDLIVSSMALHYVEDLDRLFRHAHLLLRTGGRLLFSMEHPVCTAAPDGYAEDGRGKFWRLSRYFERGLRTQRWFIDGVQKMHRPLGDIVGSVLHAGFSLDALDEPEPIVPPEQVANPSGAYYWIRPPLLVVAATKHPIP